MKSIGIYRLVGKSTASNLRRGSEDVPNSSSNVRVGSYDRRGRASQQAEGGAINADRYYRKVKALSCTSAGRRKSL